jgi:cell division control protein 7
MRHHPAYIPERRMLDVSLLHGQVMQTNIPTISENGHSWEKILLWCKNRNKRDNGLTDEEQEAVEFMKACLELDPGKRITAKGALKHPFLRGVGDAASEDTMS